MANKGQWPYESKKGRDEKLKQAKILSKRLFPTIQASTPLKLIATYFCRIWSVINIIIDRVYIICGLFVILDINSAEHVAVGLAHLHKLVSLLFLFRHHHHKIGCVLRRFMTCTKLFHRL